ncbi:MAG: hypothetical protein U0892_04935 [Pirellulales bacterium]
MSVNTGKSLYWVRNGEAATHHGSHEIDRPAAGVRQIIDLDNDGQLDIVPNGTTFAACVSQQHPSRGEATANGRTETAYFVKVDLPQELAGYGIGIGDINRDDDLI